MLRKKLPEIKLEFTDERVDEASLLEPVELSPDDLVEDDPKGAALSALERLDRLAQLRDPF